jgi:hypothetical protein
VFKVPSQLSSKEPLLKSVVAWAADIIRSIRELQALPVLAGVLVEDVSLVSANTTAVQHKLGRVPRGFVVTNLTDNATVWHGQAPDANALYLYASTDTTVDLWVF